MRAVIACLCTFIVLLLLSTLNVFETDEATETSFEMAVAERLAGTEKYKATKRARADYYFNMLRDPATNQIPQQIRRKELAFSKALSLQQASKSASAPRFSWLEAGPTDVGGRTRALAVDRGNSSNIIAGGASGGIWKSTNGGSTWVLKSDPDKVFGITYITQDPRPGNEHLWYATTGEFSGSNSDRGFRAFSYGPGILQSVDNGESWSLIRDPGDNPTSFNSPFDYGIKLLVSPTTGTFFLASNGFGVGRSTNLNSGVTTELGRKIFPEWSDIDIASNGNVIAVTSDGFFDDADGVEFPGVFLSTNDGQSWQDITPADYPDEPGRSVIAFAPSDPNVAYMFTFTGNVSPSNNAFDEEEEVQFFKFNLSNPNAVTIENRSDNLPDFGGQVSQVYTQGSYNMAIAVKSNDPNHVFIGGTNLYRSKDGFATPADNIFDTWVGGYATVNNISSYNNHHPDQHILFFDPDTPTALWSGHDGGISFVTDLNPTSNALAWQDKNSGFVTTQFYHVALAPQPGDDRILGGTQDNGSLYFRFDPQSQTRSASEDVSSGDGTYAFLGEGYAIASTQNGAISAYRYDASGDLLYNGEITPAGANGQLFVNPFAIDKIDENIIYYPAGNQLYRRGPEAENPTDWDQLNSISLPAGYSISALESGIFNGNSVLYFAASGIDLKPKVYRLDDAAVSTSAATEISIPDPPPPAEPLLDAYIHDIAVNPNNGNEILVVMSNYNVIGTYHSSNGGTSYSAVEGNLTGTEIAPGPSIRSAAILQGRNSTIYLLGTSIGLFSTETLAGGSTNWEQEAAARLGSAIVEQIAVRPSDGRIALATHGRGVFLGTPLNPVPNEDEPTIQPNAFSLAQNYPNPFNPSTTISFSLAQASRVSLDVYDITGRRLKSLLVDAVKEPGQHSLAFHAGTLSSGSYIYTVEARPLGTAGATYKESKVMILSK